MKNILKCMNWQVSGIGGHTFAYLFVQTLQATQGVACARVSALHDAYAGRDES